MKIVAVILEGRSSSRQELEVLFPIKRKLVGDNGEIIHEKLHSEINGRRIVKSQNGFKLSEFKPIWKGTKDYLLGIGNYALTESEEQEMKQQFREYTIKNQTPSA